LFLFSFPLLQFFISLNSLLYYKGDSQPWEGKVNLKRETLLR
jgi:hypothetical protein